jgi:hypothetical protein
MRRARLGASLLLVVAAAALVSAQAGGLVTEQLSAPVRQSAAWTSATAQDTPVTVSTANLAHVLVTFTPTGSITGGGLYFEVDDGTTTWWGTPATQTAGVGAGTITASGQSVPIAGVGAVAWEFDLPAWAQFRVRLNPAIAGGGTANVSLLTSAGSSEPSVFTTPSANGQPQTTLAIQGLQQLLQQLRPTTALRGTLGQPITSTGSALDVNVKNSIDPCQGPKNNVAISQTASAVLLTAQPGRVVICGLKVVAADAENLSLVEGTGSTCATGTSALDGGTTAATGPNLAAGGGWVEGFTGYTIAPQKTINNDICLLQSGSGRVAGHASYVVVPR